MPETQGSVVCNDIIYELSISNYVDSINISGWAYRKKQKNAGKIQLILVNEEGNQYLLDPDTVKRYDLKYIYMSNNLVDAGFSVYLSKEFLNRKYHIYIMIGDKVINTVYDISLN